MHEKPRGKITTTPRRFLDALLKARIVCQDYSIKKNVGKNIGYV